MMKNAFPALMIVTLASAGCNDGMNLLKNPEGLRASQANGHGADGKSVEDWGLSFPQVMEFQEGVKGEYTVQAWVPAPGKATVTIDPLPEGAQFDGETGKLVWTPSSTAANDPQMPASDARHYTVKLTLKSDLAPMGVYEREAVLVVKNTRGDFKVDLGVTDLTAVEGSELTQAIHVTDGDFAQGPFSVRAEGLPFGATIEPGATPGDFVLKYTPSPQAVSVINHADEVWNSTAGAYERHFNVTVFASNPRGEVATSQAVNLAVTDKRMAPVVSGPTDIVQAADVAFALVAQDPNGEGAPTVTLLNQPQKGRFSMTESKEGTVDRIDVLWNGVPKELFGTTTELNFQACAPGNAGDAVCATQVVKVKIQSTAKNPPAVTRTEWPVGSFRYIRTGDTLSVSVGIVDADFPEQPVDVVLKSTDSSDGLQYQDGVLAVTAGTAGFRQITLTASSFQGAVATESFALMVVPKK
ncbi:MAG TPA: hypothetical protein VL588_07435 [Bdellovibrionota bacterium]|jgi:hypothetical protein|nr:hypothetical protein [Bdellovibrionota bacterium]